MLFQPKKTNRSILSDQAGQNTMEYLVLGTILIGGVIIVAWILYSLIIDKGSSIGW